MTIFDTNTAMTAKPTPARLSLVRRLTQAVALRRQRIALSQLDDHLLRDVGVTAQDAQKEAARKPWDAPETWVK